jgi:hypothetical protein
MLVFKGATLSSSALVFLRTVSPFPDVRATDKAGAECGLTFPLFILVGIDALCGWPLVVTTARRS